LAGLDTEQKPTTVRTEGLLAIRDALRSGIAAIEGDIARLKSARTAADTQMSSLTKSRDQLEQDRADWQQDIDAATRVADAFAGRLQGAEANLTGVTQATVRLGRELTEAVARLTTEIDRRAPAPDRAATPGGVDPIR
jgi:chromosome segregation ATPase